MVEGENKWQTLIQNAVIPIPMMVAITNIQVPITKFGSVIVCTVIAVSLITSSGSNSCLKNNFISL